MKFYKYKYGFGYFNKIMVNKFNAIYSDRDVIAFYRNGKLHNTKNASYILFKNKSFCLNANHYGYECDFTKESWRRFVKMQVFL